MFLRTAIEKILHEKDIRKYSQLKKACEVALQQLEENGQTNDGNIGQTVVPGRHESMNAEKHFLPFDLACQSRSPKIQTIALDSIQKLVAYGHLVGKDKIHDDVNPNRERFMIDRIVETICACFTGPNTDETVQLQV